MKSQNIVFTEPNVTKLVTEPVPTPGDGQVLVKLCVSAISSGTERANLSGCKTVGVGIKDEDAPKFPRRGGYSSAGIVEQVGSAVTSVKVGDRVAVIWGTHNQYVVAPEENVFQLGDVSFEDAALVHIAAFPLAAIRKCRLELGESAVVMGLGVLGLAAVALLRTAGATPVIAVDPDPVKREKALQCGADVALDPYAEDFAETAKAVTNGGANVGIEVTGIGAGLDGILDCMAPFGRVALLGCTRNRDFTIDYYRKVHGPGITLIGAHTFARPKIESFAGWWTQRDDVESLIRLVATNRLNLASMVDEIHSPVDAEQVYGRLLTDKTFPIVEFDWRRL